MEYRITVGERQETVELSEEESGYRVRIGDRTFDVDVHRLEPGSVLSLLVDGRSLEAEVVPEDGGYQVHLPTGSFLVEVQHELLAQAGQKRGAPPVTGAYHLATDMPGVVVEVKVAPGEAVEAGQPLVVVEAMKMQNELSTAQPGVVREVHVAPGDSVAAGAKLVSLEARTGG